MLDVTPLTENGDDHLEVSFSGDDEALAGLLAGLVGNGFGVTRFHEESGDLEDVFMRLTRGVVS